MCANTYAAITFRARPAHVSVGSVQLLGVDELKVIAQVILSELRKNVTVDWAHRKSARVRHGCSRRTSLAAR